MNIPDEGFFTLLTQGMRNRTVETLQRALYHTLRDAILQGTLTARCRLPGSRVMAERLHLSRNTVNAALEQLALEGYLTRSRQGTQVAPLASCRQEAGQMPPVVLPERLQRLPAAMRRDSPTLAFTPGMPAVNYFPLPLWRRLMDNVLREDGSALLGYGEARAILCCERLSLVIWRSPGASGAISGRSSSPKARWKASTYAPRY